MNASGVVTAGRITHRTAGVDELAAASPESHTAAVAELQSVPAVTEAFVLQTCNRVEAYVVTPERSVGRATLEAFFEDTPTDAVRMTGHDESLRHLIRVAAGLESVVVGEDQILGQVRQAFEDATRADGIGELLEPAVTKAIHVGERARTETAINEGVTSLGSAATSIASKTVDLASATALVVGAGQMGQLAARCLADAGVDRLYVANRTLVNAKHVTAELEGDVEAIGLNTIRQASAEADVIVAATASPEPVIEPCHVAGGEPVVIDLGQPRDVAPTVSTCEGVTVYDLDDLEAITAETHDERTDAAAAVEAMVDREFEHLCEQYKRSRADTVIAAMYESAERIKARELETALGKLEHDSLTDDQRAVVESMADALVSQLLAPPTKSLREAAAEDDWETITTALQLFDPQFGDQERPSPTQSAQLSEMSVADDD